MHATHSPLRYDPAAHIPPPPAPATLSISPNGFLHLHAALRQQLSLWHGQPINLVPPAWNSLFWHLDLRPTASQRIQWYANTRPRVEGILLPPGLVTEPLTLYLWTAEPEHAHYYPLVAAHALLPKPSRRPWQPTPAKKVYAQHAARDSRYDGALWQAARKAQIQRCPYCEACTRKGRTTAATVTDHITPVRLGGAFYDPANHQSLCRACHQAKSASERTQTA